MKPPGFRLRFPERDIPALAARFPNAGTDDDILVRIRPLTRAALPLAAHSRPGKRTFWEIVVAIQNAMGRKGYHLREFEKSSVRIEGRPVRLPRL